MKKIALCLALASCVPAHAEDLSPAIRGCQSFTSAGDFIAATARKSKPHVTDGVSYFAPRAGIVFNGLPILAVFAYGYGLNRVSTDPAFGYGVVLEGTPSYGAILVKDSAAHVTPSPVSLPGHEFIEIGCTK